jgi:bifunctional non-homologous end joining protein LigD
MENGRARTRALNTGRRSDTLGSLILGSYDAHRRLRYAGHVGTSFDEATLRDLLRLLEPLRRATSPLDEPVPRGGGSTLNYPDFLVVDLGPHPRRKVDLRHLLDQ